MKKISRRMMLGAMTTTGLVTVGYIGLGMPQLAMADEMQPLKIPTLENGYLIDGVRNFDLNLQRGQSQFIDGVSTPTYGINDNYLGSTLKMNAGETVQMNVTNQIGRISTLHWHGMHLPAAADGGPHQLIENGSTWQSRFEVKQHASTFWYHSHVMGETGFQVYHGLAGVIIVEDENANSLGLPQDYGVDDIPLILQDRQFNDDGSFAYLATMHDSMMGMKGDKLLVNGTLKPFFVVKTDQLRLRLLNGSNSRIYNLSFDDGRSFHQIASDGGLLEKPVQLTKLTLAPGERVELIVDVSDGKTSLLQSTSPNAEQGMMGSMMSMFEGGTDGFDVLEIRPATGLATGKKLPQKLADITAPNLNAVVKTRKFVLDLGMGMAMMGGSGTMTINGKSMDINRIDEVVKLGTSEIWEIINPTDQAHPFHIHDVQFRILDRDGQPAIETERGFKDTVLIPAGQNVRLFLSFADYADAERPYMYHCHILEHEDGGMMGQFTVVA